VGTIWVWLLLLWLTGFLVFSRAVMHQRLSSPGHCQQPIRYLQWASAGP